MALKEVKMEAYSLTEYPNKKITGFYIDTRKVKTKFGESELHEFYNPDKQEYFSFWGVTAFDSKMKLVPRGCWVEWTYLGKEMAKTQYGDREVHKVKVAYDAERTMTLKKVETVIEDDDDNVPFTQKQAQKPKIDDEDLPF